ncbi:MAG: hypothetical protein E7253_00910 [Lachnospiraceae bacterium]|nr:hypothetical protein [Lachnospiraceae bacterium]
MKLSCEICGGTLEMKSGGRGAECTICGLNYSLDYLKEMVQRGERDISIEKVDKKEIKEHNEIRKDFFDRQERHDMISVSGIPVTAVGLPKLVDPPQFLMQVEMRTEKKLFRTQEYFFGNVIQGGLGNGDKFFVNDMEWEEEVYSGGFFSDYEDCVKAGAYGRIDSVFTDSFKALRAFKITGERNPKINAYNYRGTVEEYFAAVMLKEFPEYSLYKEVQEEDGRVEADYMLFRNNKPVVAVYLVDSHDNSRTRAVKRAIKAYAEEGIGGVHFFSDYRNDLDYVKERIADAMYVW